MSINFPEPFSFDFLHEEFGTEKNDFPRCERNYAVEVSLCFEATFYAPSYFY
jgi:hypothetical protein